MANQIKPSEIAVNRDELKNIMNQIEELKAERKQLYHASIQVFEIIGMAEKGELKVQSGGFNFMECIKGALPTLRLIIASIASSRAQEKLAEKFAFFKPLIPLFEKINNEVKNAA